MVLSVSCMSRTTSLPGFRLGCPQSSGGDQKYKERARFTEEWSIKSALSVKQICSLQEFDQVIYYEGNDVMATQPGNLALTWYCVTSTLISRRSAAFDWVRELHGEKNVGIADYRHFCASAAGVTKNRSISQSKLLDGLKWRCRVRSSLGERLSFCIILESLDNHVPILILHYKCQLSPVRMAISDETRRTLTFPIRLPKLRRCKVHRCGILRIEGVRTL